MKIKIICYIPESTVVDAKDYWGIQDDDWNKLSEKDILILVAKWARLHVMFRYEVVE